MWPVFDTRNDEHEKNTLDNFSVKIIFLEPFWKRNSWLNMLKEVNTYQITHAKNTSAKMYFL